MSAQDTFEWCIATIEQRPGAEMETFIKAQREYLHTLRSEDERQRFVEGVIQQLRLMEKQGRRKA